MSILNMSVESSQQPCEGRFEYLPFTDEDTEAQTQVFLTRFIINRSNIEKPWFPQIPLPMLLTTL